MSKTATINPHEAMQDAITKRSETERAILVALGDGWEIQGAFNQYTTYRNEEKSQIKTVDVSDPDALAPFIKVLKDKAEGKKKPTRKKTVTRKSTGARRTTQGAKAAARKRR